MKAEVEAKFLNVDIGDIRQKLTNCGGQLAKPMRLMRRAIFDYPDRRMQTENNGWIRVRDEGDKVTLTYKESTEGSFGGAKEHEVTVDSFETTCELFKSIGLKMHSFQESNRETWNLDAGEVVIDEWPWLNPYIEIEAKTKKEVMEIAERLGLEWSRAVFGSVTSAYRHQYPAIHDDEHISTLQFIRFSDDRPDFFVK
jgi:adenylate cyclase class 2